MSTTQQVIAIILGGIGIATTALGVLRWLIRVEMQSVKHELSNNGGSSMKDKVDANTDRLERVEGRIDDIYKILCEHK